MTGAELFRLPPQGPVTAYKTYGVNVPRATHTRVVGCREYECEAYQHGWETRIDVSTELGARQARYITEQSGRHHSWEHAWGQSEIVIFRFPPGQECFREHRIQSQPALYVIRDGDHRGNPTGRRQTVSARAWVDDFGEHQERLADKQKEG